MVSDAAKLAVVQDTLPLIFSYLHQGMEQFDESLVFSMQSVPPNVDVDVPYLLPTPPTVIEGVMKPASSLLE